MMVPRRSVSVLPPFVLAAPRSAIPSVAFANAPRGRLRRTGRTSCRASAVVLRARLYHSYVVCTVHRTLAHRSHPRLLGCVLQSESPCCGVHPESRRHPNPQGGGARSERQDKEI